MLFSAVLAAFSAVCSLRVVIAAFRRSVGSGVMVLTIPCFAVYYGFRHFEHPRKGLLLAGWLALLPISIALFAVALQGSAVVTPPLPG